MFLTNSKLIKRLMAYAFTHPDEEYYVRELAGLIDEDPGNLSRVLKRLEDEGVFHSKSKAGAKFYSLNPKYPLFPELKKMILKTEGVAGSLKNIVEKFKAIRLAFIFGSYAKGKEGRTSDVDMVIVGNPEHSALTKAIRELESKLGREINFTIYSGNEFDRERKKKGSFLEMVIKEKIIILKGKLDA